MYDRENPTKEVPLHWAVLRNNYKITKRLVKEHKAMADLHGAGDEDEDSYRSGGILDFENQNWQTPFFVAVIKGFLDIAELLA